jgi:short-subunit dehydrogenase
VRGFTETLQIELAMTRSPVSATCVHPGGIKTNIARRSKVHPSLATLGVDVENAGRDFERTFRVSADEAAEIILRGVQKNARRVLVGADARMLDAIQRLLPGAYHGIVARFASSALRARS